MTDLRLSARETEDVLAGRQPDGRADLAALVEVAAVLHASREVEPPPPMSDALRAQLEQGVPRPIAMPSRRRRHRPRHMQAVTPQRSALAAYRRPVISVAAAAVVLIGLIVATSGHLPREVHSAVADVGSAIGLDLFRGDDAAGTDPSAPTTSSTSTTTTTTAPTTTLPPQSTTTAPPTTQAPVVPPPGEHELPWWLQPEFWEEYYRNGGAWGGDQGGDDDSGDGDRDGDGDGRGAGSGWGDGQPGTAGPHDRNPDTTPTPTTAAPTSSSTSAPTETTGPAPSG